MPPDIWLAHNQITITGDNYQRLMQLYAEYVINMQPYYGCCGEPKAKNHKFWCDNHQKGSDKPRQNNQD